MDKHIEFGKERIVNYFKKTTVSKIYADFYPYTHALEDFRAPETDCMRSVCYAITKQLKSMLSENGEDPSSLAYGGLGFELIGTLEYEKTIKKIREQLGEDKLRAYLEEYEAIGRLLNSIRVILMFVYSKSRKNMPKRMQNILHRDTRKVHMDEFSAFIKRMEKHPDKNKIQIDANFKNQIYRLYSRILYLEEFYHQHKEAKDLTNVETYCGKPIGKAIPVDMYRDELFMSLNKRFNTEK